jgi:ribosomal 50S subunit-recycling heat shock protein
MYRFKKPRYKIYLNLLEDVRNDFYPEKFNYLKWNKLKKILKFKINKWLTLKLYKKIYYVKKLNFFYNHSKIFLGFKKKIFTKMNNNSIFFFFNKNRFKKKLKINLLNKQKILYYYNLKNYQLKNLIRNNKNKKFHDYFIKILEKRLDNILYKSGFVRNICQSRQLIIYGKVKINKIKQSKPNYLIKVGDIVEFNHLSNVLLKHLLLPYNKNIKKNIVFSIYDVLKNRKSKFFFNKKFSNIKKKFYFKKKDLYYKKKDKRYKKNYKYYFLNNKITNNKLFFKKKITNNKLFLEKKKKFLENYKKYKETKNVFLKKKYEYLLAKLIKFNKKNLTKKVKNILIKKNIKKIKYIYNYNYYKKCIKYQFFFFFSNFLEINYKTLSILCLKNINVKKSFKFFLNLLSIKNYYYYR